MQKYLIILIFILICSTADAAYVLQKGKLVNSLDVPCYSSEEHYRRAVEAFEAKNYPEAALHFNVISVNFQQATFYHESIFFLGVCQFYDDELDISNDTFNKYLTCQSNPRYFEEALGYKLQIADQFASGAKKRFFGTKLLPKWAPAGSLAIEIYDEVIAALPCHPYAAYALYSKAMVYWREWEYRDAIDAFQQLIRRFPKDELTPTSYVCISKLYVDLAEMEINNPDILALAEINCKRFKVEFPKEERLAEVEGNLQTIKELYAKGLFDTAQFYERKEQPCASIFYYRSTIEQFPDTSYAKCSRRRLEILTLEQSAVDQPNSKDASE